MKLFVWDLDDTLIDNVHDYAQPLLDACSLVIRELGCAAPHVTAIIALEQEIDHARVKEINPKTGKAFGYTMERFPGSMVELYRRICAKSNLEPVSGIEKRLWDIGMQAFDESRYEDKVKPGAVQVLRRLKDKGHRNVVLTKGDPRVQEKKVLAFEASALKQHVKNIFDEVKIVETNKDPEVFGEILDRHHPDSAFAIGNDYKKDVLPALQARPEFRGVWIPVETWETMGHTDKVMAEVDKDRCEVLSKIFNFTESFA